MNTPRKYGVFKGSIVAAVAFALWLPLAAVAMGKDDPLLGMLVLEQLEYRSTDGHDPRVLEGYGWLGYDLNKLWVDFEVEQVDGETEEAEWQLRYSRALSSYWDFQLGLRRDFEPSPRRNWVVIGLHGLAPYWFETDAALFIGESGRSAIRVSSEYELKFTQRIVLVPEVEINAYGHNDPSLGVGSGLADIETGLRLRYEIRREFAPYFGFNWLKRFGNTRDYARLEGEGSEYSQWVLGLRVWF